MNSRQSARRTRLRDQMRELWSQHVYWTRMDIISAAAGLDDAAVTTERLLRNPADFEAALAPFYGQRAAARFRGLLTEHLQLAAELIGATKANEPEKAAQAREKWYANAVELARLLAELNPAWNERGWEELLFGHLALTEREAALRLAGRYAEDTAVFERIEREALEMADVMSDGIVRQFGLRR